MLPFKNDQYLETEVYFEIDRLYEDFGVSIEIIYRVPPHPDYMYCVIIEIDSNFDLSVRTPSDGIVNGDNLKLASLLYKHIENGNLKKLGRIFGKYKIGPG